MDLESKYKFGLEKIASVKSANHQKNGKIHFILQNRIYIYFKSKSISIRIEIILMKSDPFIQKKSNQRISKNL